MPDTLKLEKLNRELEKSEKKLRKAINDEKASGPIIGYTNYDMYLKGIEFLSAVIGAGCYWIGSNKNSS